MGIIQGFLRRFRRGQPVNQVADTTNLNRIANILEGIQGVGCRVEKPIDAEGRGWRIVVGDGSDLNPAETVTDSPTGQAHPEGGGGVDTNDYAWRFSVAGDVVTCHAHGAVYSYPSTSISTSHPTGMSYNSTLKTGLSYDSTVRIPQGQTESTIPLDQGTLGVLVTNDYTWCWAYRRTLSQGRAFPLEGYYPALWDHGWARVWMPVYTPADKRYLTQGDVWLGGLGARVDMPDDYHAGLVIVTNISIIDGRYGRILRVTMRRFALINGRLADPTGGGGEYDYDWELD